MYKPRNYRILFMITLLAGLFATLVATVKTTLAQSDDAVEPAPEEVQALAFLAGTWDIEARLQVGEDDWQTGAGVAVIDWHLEGHLLREAWAAVFPGLNGDGDGDGARLVEGITARGYHPSTRTWQMVWADSYADGLRALVGEDRDNTYTFSSRGVAGEVWRVVMAVENDDAFSLTLAAAAGVGRDYIPRWEVAYTRQDADPAVGTAQLAALRDSAEPLPLAPEATHFDFWIGDWWVISRQGSGPNAYESLGRDQVKWVMGGHAFEELWDGRQLSRAFWAFSLSRWNPGTGFWDNVWFSTSTDSFQFFQGDGCDADQTYCTLAGSFQPRTADSIYWQIPREGTPSWTLWFHRRQE